MGKRQAPQKDAIYKVITEVLGGRFQDGENALTLLGSPHSPSSAFSEVRQRIHKGLVDGSIPSGPSRQGQGDSLYLRTNRNEKLRHYANNILRYWLRNDPRLGGSSSRKSRKPRNLEINFLLLKARDEVIKEFEGVHRVIHNLSPEHAAVAEIFVLKRKFTLLLNALNVAPESLPKAIQEELLILNTSPKKAAA